MDRGNLPLAIALVGLGALLMWVGYANPPGGLFGVIGDAVRGKKTATGGAPSTSVGDLAGLLASQPVNPLRTGVAPDGSQTPTNGGPDLGGGVLLGPGGTPPPPRSTPGQVIL